MRTPRRTLIAALGIALAVPLAGAVAAAPATAESGNAVSAAEPAFGETGYRPRTIVTTDPELDDLNSMIRFLLYSNEVRTEGLVYTSSRFHWSGDGKGTLFFLPGREYTTPQTEWRWPTGQSHIEDALDAYAKVYDNLRTHDPDYPTPAELRSKFRVGNIEFEGDTSKETPGSELIEQVLLDDKGGPVFVQAWGGTSTIARALKSIQETYQGTAQWDAVYRKISDKAIITRFGAQDETYANYIATNWPEIENRQVSTTSWGYGARGAIVGSDAQYLSSQWMRQNVSNVGPLGALYRVWGDGRFMVPGDLYDFFGYDSATVTAAELRARGYTVWTALQAKDSWISEGDSSNFALLADNGLRSYVSAGYGGWGSRQVPSPTNPNLWVAGTDRNEAGQAPRDYATARWFEDIQLDFAARLQWSVTPRYEDANHAPVVAMAGSGQDVRVKPGLRVNLRVSASDPDGDRLTYRWWQYREAGTYAGAVSLTGADTPAPSFAVPTDAKAGDTMHLILEAQDDGTPSLTRYQRVIVTVVDIDQSLQDADALVQSLRAQGAISASTAAGLRDRLAHAIALSSIGSESRTLAYVQQAIARVNNQVRNAGARAALLAVLQQIAADLQQFDDLESGP